MEKNINWHEIDFKNSLAQVPSKRWGHKTVYIEDEIILFGGFSDLTYLNDLWAYNIHTNRWRQIKTTGKKPQGKSNFTMHFDNRSNQLIIFGGGGPNKIRFNKISLLSWETKVWTQIINDDQNSPWERTYHSSEFKYPFLITFGGQGAANLDFDDLWVFNIQTKQWKQIKPHLKKQANPKVKTCGRRFHSTALINYQFYVVSGCTINYTCIASICSVDLKPFFDEQSSTKTPSDESEQEKQQLQVEWKVHHVADKQTHLIERWGHSSQAYNGKIYIFGGRNREDYNDLLEFDPQTDKVTQIVHNSSEINSKLPKSRRRHSSCMIGASMIIFGGFNMEYFSDLQHVSLFQCRDNLSKQKYLQQQDSEVIQLQELMFAHFLEEMNKEKPEYDIEIQLETQKLQHPFVVKSVSSLLVKNSRYFKNVIKYNQICNPERNYISVHLDSSTITPIAFQLFNAFLMQGLLILPKNYKLKRLCQLLACADYFQNKTLFALLQKLLTLKVIDQTQNLDDIFNIAANWKMNELLRICSQKKILNKTYFNSKSRIICLNHNAARLKQKFIQEMLIQIQFDQIQKGQRKKQNVGEYLHFGKNNKQFCTAAEQKDLCPPKLLDIRRKKSFVQKFVESFSKLCSCTPSCEQIKLQQKQPSTTNYESDDQQQIENQIKIF